MSIHKSKGLEFPVVFLCGLSKAFNTEDARSPVLCDSDLGLGLCCADMKNRIKYPTIAKNAIAAKMIEESISEEMRVLYVAMTRARDRLIMTHAQRKPENDLADIAYRMDVSPLQLLTANVSCSGDWVLMSALRRQEAGAFFRIAVRPEKNVRICEEPWLIDVIMGQLSDEGRVSGTVSSCATAPDGAIERIGRLLKFEYSHKLATGIPSKQTATQLKGRQKDMEAAEGTVMTREKNFRKPSFVGSQHDSRTYGTAMHAAMQRIHYERCLDRASIDAEIRNLVSEGVLSSQYGDIVNTEQIAAFFQTQIGKSLRTHPHVLREFKFSLLDDCSRYFDGVADEQILLQGVVDCALIDDDGICVLDFKTDYVTEETIADVAQHYHAQVEAYASALERIFQKPVKSAKLYFFRLNKFVSVL